MYKIPQNLLQFFKDTGKKTKSMVYVVVIKSIIEKIADYAFEYKNFYIKSESNYSKLDSKKFKKVGKYFSYYKYSDKHNKVYPNVKHVKKEVAYTDYQLKIYLAIIYSKVEWLTNEELIKLTLFKTEAEAILNKDNNFPRSYYTKKGIIIGNMFPSGELSPKDIPNKFLEIIKIYKNKPVNTIVYSNYYKSGILFLSKILQKFGISHEIYSPSKTNEERNTIIKNFESGKSKMLLLHPSYYQGFSIKKTRVFHILEPVESYSKLEQLESRVIRYKSHYDLPKKQQNVIIYHWCCSIKNIFRYFNFKIKDISHYLKHDTERFYLGREQISSDLFTPDDIIYSNINSTVKFFESFNKVIKVNSIEENNIFKDTCCVYGDTSCSRHLKNCSTLN